MFFIIALCGGHGFATILTKILRALLSDSFITFGGLAAIFYFLCLWFYEDIKKEYKVRDDERSAVEKHRRHKQSVILRNHPLLESPDDTHGIQSMDQLDYYFDRNREDVDQLDYDKDGHWIFKDHKYFLG